MPTRGKLVALEGIDGAGKTTLAGLLGARLRARGYATKTVSRYFCSELTGLWRHLISADAVNQREAALLAAADASIGTKQVLAALQQGEIVLADRYVYSHLLYFRLRGVDPAYLETLFAAVPPPDVVFYLAVEVSEARRRLQAKQKPDFWEAALDCSAGMTIGQAYRSFVKNPPSTEELEESHRLYQCRVLDLYPDLLPAHRTYQLDGHREAAQVLERCWRILASVLPQAGGD